MGSTPRAQSAAGANVLRAQESRYSSLAYRSPVEVRAPSNSVDRRSATINEGLRNGFLKTGMSGMIGVDDFDFRTLSEPCGSKELGIDMAQTTFPSDLVEMLRL